MRDKTEDQIRKGLKLLAEDVQAPEGEAGGHAGTWFLPRLSPRLGAVLAGAAICATVGALAATGTFSGGHTAAAKGPGRGPVRSGGPMIPAVPVIPPVRIVAHRAADETLISLHVRIHSYTAHDNIQFQVVHSDPTGGDSVVYTKQVTTGDNYSSCPSGSTGAAGPTGSSDPTGASGPTGAPNRRWACYSTGSEWSGTLVPSDWNGGCQTSGKYWIAVGTFHSETFMCDAVGPTGASGPTGAAGSAR
jgi:hypothetical protein